MCYKSEFMIKLWERMGHNVSIYDDECSAVYAYIWRLPNLKTHFKITNNEQNLHLLMKMIIVY